MVEKLNDIKFDNSKDEEWKKAQIQRFHELENDWIMIAVG